MRIYPLGILLGLHLFAGSLLEAFYEVAGGEIIAEISLNASYSSNVSGSNVDGLQEVDPNASDFFWSVQPGLRFIRNQGRSSITATVSVDNQRFSSNSDLNFTGYNANASATFPVAAGSPLSGSFSLGTSQRQTIDEITNLRTETTNYTFSGNAGYAVTEKMQVTFGANFSDSDQSDVSSTRSYGFDLGINRPIRTELRAGLSLSLNRQETDGQFTGATEDPTIDNYSINATLSGPITERINGNVSAGWQQSDGAGSDGGSLTTSGSLNWNPRNKTSVGLSFSRSTQLNTEDRAVTSNNLDLSVSQSLTTKLSAGANAGLSFSEGRTDDRTDKVYTLGANANYTFTKYWSAGASISHSIRDTLSSEDVFTATVTTSLNY